MERQLRAHAVARQTFGGTLSLSLEVQGTVKRCNWPFIVNVRLLADGSDRRIITGLLYLGLTTFLGAACGIMAVLMLGLRGGQTITSSVSLFQFLGYCLLVTSAILALRVLAFVFRPKRA